MFCYNATVSEISYSPEQQPENNGYFGVRFSNVQENKGNGVFVNNASITIPDTPPVPIGNLEIKWRPGAGILQSSHIVPGIEEAVGIAAGGLAGFKANAKIETDGTINRRNFLKGVAGAAVGMVTGETVAYNLTPQIARPLIDSKYPDLWKNDPMRAALGMSYPWRAINQELGKVRQLDKTPELLSVETVRENPDYSVDAMHISHQNGNDTVYMVKPKDVNTVRARAMVSAAHASTPGFVTLGENLQQFTYDVTHDAAKQYDIVGLTDEIRTFHHNSEFFFENHTVPTAIALSADNKPISLTSATWSHPFSMNYGDLSEANITTPTEWLCLASKSGIWSPDLLKKFDKNILIADIRKNLAIWKAKFTADGLTEAIAGHPAYHRHLMINNEGQMSILSDEEGWNYFEQSILTDPDSLESFSLIRPGTLLDMHKDNNPGERKGGAVNLMAINGLLFDEKGTYLSTVTLNQDVRFNSDLLKDFLNKLDPNARYYLGTDEHGGGGIVLM